MFGRVGKDRFRALGWGVLFTAVLAVLIIFGSRNLAHFDAALVGYTFATLFATFGITYRYAMWLQRPPTPVDETYKQLLHQSYDAVYRGIARYFVNGVPPHDKRHRTRVP